MAKVTSFTKQNLSDVRAKINAALEAVEKDLGVKIDLGNIRYTENSFKTEMNVVIAKGAVADPMFADVPAQYVNDLIKWKGQPAVGKRVSIIGQPAIIVGIRNRNYIFKWAPEAVNAKKQPGLRKIAFRNYDQLDCQVTGNTFDPKNVMF